MTRLSLIAAACLAVVAAALPAAAQAPSGRVVLYTSQLAPDAQQTVDAFQAAYPGIKVEWTRDGTTQLINKLRAEIAAGAPQPDVLLVADAMTLEALKRENRLMAYKEAKTDGFPDGAHDPDKTYFATKLITTGIIYNKAAAMKPESWADLVKPEAKGQVIMPSPLYSGAAAIHMGVLTRVPALGWPYYETLAKNGTQSARGNGAVFDSVAGGQKLYGVLVDFMAIRNKLKGSPVEFVFPKDGVTAITEPVGILSTARNPAAAKAFVDFILSKDGQLLASKQGMFPARDDVTPPEGFPELAKIKILPADIAAILTSDEADKKRFADMFGR
jgi:iron(III) transport system substrate-binding protein